MFHSNLKARDHAKLSVRKFHFPVVSHGKGFALVTLVGTFLLTATYAEAGALFRSEVGYLGTVVDTPAITNEFGYYPSFGGPRDDRRDMNKGITVRIGNTIIDPHYVRRIGNHGKAMQMAAGGRAHALPGKKAELALWAEANSYVRLSNFTKRAGGLGHSVEVDLTTNAQGILDAIAQPNPEELDSANAKFYYEVKNHTTGEMIFRKEISLFASEGQNKHLGINESDSFTIKLPKEERYDIETYGYVYSSGLSLANNPPLSPDDAAKHVQPFQDRARQPLPDPAMGLPQPVPVFGTAEGFGGFRLDYVGAVHGDDPAAMNGLPTFYIDETLITPNEPLDIWITVEVPEEGTTLMAVDNLLQFAPGFHAAALQMQIGTGVGEDFALSENLELLGMSHMNEPLDLRPELLFDTAGMDDAADGAEPALSYLLNLSDQVDGVLDGFATFTLRQIVDGTAGDYNGNGISDMADYTVWRNHLGAEGIGMPADGDGNGMVDRADYEVWRGSLGESFSVPTAILTTVPEPSSWLMVAMFSLAMACRYGMARNG